MDITQSFLNFIRQSYSPQEKVKENKEGSKTIFFRKAGRSLCYIDLNNEGSFVTIVIGETLQEKVMDLDISEKVKNMFTNSKAYHDGKWLNIKLEKKEDLEDIKKLLLVKRKIVNKEITSVEAKRIEIE